MTTRNPRLIAVDGVDAAAIRRAAREALAGVERKRRTGISEWDASGIFHELAAADDSAGRASVRTLLLLYAADLAFRLRWEIRPVLQAGKSVVAAPYVATAVAFGRAAGLPARWLDDLFSFAPAAEEAVIAGADSTPGRDRHGFVEFGCRHLHAGLNGLARSELAALTAAYLRTALPRRRGARAG